MSKKGKIITASIISQSGMTKGLVLFDQLLITHYSLLITHYEGYRRLQQLLLLLRTVIPA
jgi:hypothetical protein